MLRRGQILLVTGILLTIFSMAMTTNYFPERKWIYITSEIFLLAATVLVIWGVVLVVRSKLRKR